MAASADCGFLMQICNNWFANIISSVELAIIIIKCLIPAMLD
jgi:hypothetical protein